MSQPVAYVPATSFLTYQAQQPWFPGQNIDAELNALKATTDQIRTNLALIQGDTGNFVSLPTTDPHVVGQWWANSHVVTISAG